jgi:hypothetical protein
MVLKPCGLKIYSIMGNPSINPVAVRYWLDQGSGARGPYQFEQIVMMWSRKELRLTDRIRKDGTDSWVDVANLTSSLEKAATGESSKAGPSNFAFILSLSALLPIIGLIMGIFWLCDSRYRSHGLSALMVFIIFQAFWLFIAVQKHWI